MPSETEHVGCSESMKSRRRCRSATLEVSMMWQKMTMKGTKGA